MAEYEQDGGVTNQEQKDLGPPDSDDEDFAAQTGHLPAQEVQQHPTGFGAERNMLESEFITMPESDMAPFDPAEDKAMIPLALLNMLATGAISLYNAQGF